VLRFAELSGGNLPVCHDDAVDADENHGGEHLLPLKGQTSARGCDELSHIGWRNREVQCSLQDSCALRGVAAPAQAFAGGGPGAEQIGIARDQVVSRLVVRVAVLDEHIDGLRDVGEQLGLCLHLLNRRIDDRVEHAVDERAHERREIKPRQLAGENGKAITR
jgi:hypothetical protein